MISAVVVPEPVKSPVYPGGPISLSGIGYGEFNPRRPKVDAPSSTDLIGGVFHRGRGRTYAAEESVHR